MIQRRRGRRGLTLMEILVVLAILVVVLVLVMAAGRAARRSAARATCMANLRQIGQLMHAYAADNSGEIPAVYGRGPGAGLLPMAWANPGVSEVSRGIGGILLLVDPPVGMARSKSLTSADIFLCPSDVLLQGRGANDFASVGAKGMRRTSYVYCYVPGGGNTYRWWEYDPATGKRFGTNSSPQWDEKALAHFERHNVNQRNAASAAILYEGHVFRVAGRPKNSFHSDGGNVLYLDGHVMDVPQHEDSEALWVSDPWAAVKGQLTVLENEAGAR